MDITTTLNYLLTPIANNYRAALEKAMNEFDLHSGQVFVLISLWEKDGQSQIELAGNLNLTAPTVNKMVKNLADNRFVKFRNSKDDGRIVLVFLTPKGMEIKQSIEKKWMTLEEQLLANFTDTEKLILLQLFDKLKTNLSVTFEDKSN